MKVISLFLLGFLTACASNPNRAEYKEEANQPRFGNSRSYVEEPEVVILAARAALDEIMRSSRPPVAGSLKGDDETVETGWVYSVSKDKYVEYQANRKPQRKPLRLRRRYGFTVTPSLAGSQVLFSVEEEVMQVDFATGKEKGWSSTDPSPEAYDFLARRLTEKLRSR